MSQSTPAAAPSRLRRFLRTSLRNLLIALAIALPVKFAVAEVFVNVGNSVGPEIPHGSRVLVYKLTALYAPGDLVVHITEDQKHFIARVLSVDTAAAQITLQRNSTDPFTLPLSRIVGRIVAQTR